MSLAFPLPPSDKDPDTLDVWAKEYYLDLGRSPRLTTATVVDANDQPVVGTDLIVGTVSWVLVDAPTNRWRFTWSLLGGDPAHVSDPPGTAAAVGIYLLRLRFWLDDRADNEPPSADRTLAIRVAQT